MILSFVVLLISPLLALGVFLHNDYPKTPAGLQFSKWLNAFNTGDKATLLAYHEANFPYDVASRDVGTITHELLLSISTGGFDIRETEDFEQYGLTALLQEIRGRRFASVAIRVSTAKPHQVVKFNIGPIATPDRFMLPDEREARKLDTTKRRKLVGEVASTIEGRYANESIAVAMASTLREKLQTGQYDKINDTRQLAEKMNEDVHSVYDDMHMGILFIWPPHAGERLSDSVLLLKILCLKNYGFGAIRKFNNGIASIEIEEFARTFLSEVRAEMSKRMSLIAGAAALIVDLRKNGGGDPATVAFIASYLFGEEKVHLNDMYNSSTNTTEEFWTDPAVEGTKFGPLKPVYILTSKQTVSGAEEFSYDLQTLKRAMLVGETTAGAANPASSYVIEPWFVAAIPNTYPINPVTGTNWEGTGVVPDVDVPSDEAFDEAKRRALESLGVIDRAKNGEKGKQEDKNIVNTSPEWEEL